MVFLASALIAIWLLTFGYLLYLLQRLRALEQEIRSLEVLLEETVTTSPK